MKTSLLCGAGLLALATPFAAEAQTSASAFTSATRYDASRRVVGTVAPDPDGSGPLRHLATRNSYDDAGRLVKIETGELSSWQSEQVAPKDWSGFAVHRTVDAGYDALGRKLRETVSSGGTVHKLTQYSYSNQGLLECTAVRMNPAAFGSLPSSACILGSEGSFGPDRITKHFYDAAGQLLKTVEALGTAEQADEVANTYTPNGKLATLTDGEGNRTTYEYDGHDRLAKTFFPVAAKGAQSSSTSDYEQYGYDPNGNRTSFRNRANETLNYSFDALNRMTYKDRPGSEPDVTYVYDLRGLQTSASFAATGETIVNSFDNLGRLTSAATTKTGATRTLTNQYDANGNRTRLTYPDGYYVDYDLDGLNRVTAIRESGATSGAGVLATYAYDSQGRRALFTRGNGATTSYSYDGASRLSQLSHDMVGTSGDLVIDMAYGPASQIISRTGSNDAYSWTAHGAESLTYASNGLNQMADRSGTPAVYDVKGNMVSDGRDRVFGYSTENLLTSFQKPSTGNPANPFSYDPLERFTQSGPSPSSPSFFQNYLYDPVADVIIAEYEPGGLFQKFVHGPGQDEPLYFIQGDRRDWYHADERGSVIGTSTLEGALRRIVQYDEYGRPGARYDSFMFTGAPYVLQGTYLMRKRFYDFLNGGRFLQSDPIGYGDGPNMYTYVGGDPVNGRDPSGEAIETPWDVANIIMGAASAGANIATGNYGRAAVDVAGVVVDTAAAVVPGVPGGAGAAIRAVRGAEHGVEAATKSGRFASKAEKAALFDRAGGKCEYCGRGMTREPGRPNSMHADHITPHVKGGRTEGPNLAGACRTCNLSKGSKDLGTQPGRDKFVPPNPNDRIKSRLNKLDN